MRKVDLKTWIEVIGITAIVISLVFVGLELQQARHIAIVEGRMNMNVASDIAVDELIMTYPAVWRRGNAGEPLDADEAELYERLIRQYTNRYFWTYASERELGESGVMIPRAVAIFLFENLGARKVWETRREKDAHYGKLFEGQSDVQLSQIPSDFYRSLDEQLRWLDSKIDN